MPLKFITLNILDGGTYFENIAAFLEKESPDIAVFQEVYNGNDKSLKDEFRSIQKLKEILPGFFYHFAPTYNEVFPFGNIQSGNAVFSKFPITNSKVTFYNAPYDPHFVNADQQGDFSKIPSNIQSLQLDIRGQVTYIFNTHGVWGFDGADNPRRLAMSDMIISQVKGKSPAILAGDFNTEPSARAILNIEKHMINIFKNELTTTFNMRHKTNPGYTTAVVDYIFVSLDIKVVSKSCPDDDVSDHKPLVATIEI